MTLLGKKDGDGGDTGVSYLDLADFLARKKGVPHTQLMAIWLRERIEKEKEHHASE